LPEKEVVVPEYEIKTRTREERVGKAKETHYMMQAGSFKTFKEADHLRAKLCFYGHRIQGPESKSRQRELVSGSNWGLMPRLAALYYQGAVKTAWYRCDYYGGRRISFCGSGFSREERG